MMMPTECDAAAESFEILLAGPTGVSSGAVLRWSGWFDPGVIYSSAESLHQWGAWWLELV